MINGNDYFIADGYFIIPQFNGQCNQYDKY